MRLLDSSFKSSFKRHRGYGMWHASSTNLRACFPDARDSCWFSHFLPFVPNPATRGEPARDTRYHYQRRGATYWWRVIDLARNKNIVTMNKLYRAFWVNVSLREEDRKRERKRASLRRRRWRNAVVTVRDEFNNPSRHERRTKGPLDVSHLS